MTELNRRFSPIHLLMLSINGMVGSAWLFAPLYATKIAGSLAIFSWLIAAFATLIIGLTFAELSVLLPVAGGTAQIPKLSHGVFVSFLMGWLAWLSALTMAPIEVQAVLQYASTYFIFLTHQVNHKPVLTGTGFMFATLLMLFFSIINIASFKGLIRFNFFLFLFKILVILLTIIVLVTLNFHAENFIIAPASPTHSWQAVLTAVASGGVAFAFTGFKHGVELAGEAKKIAIAIPMAIAGSIIFCLLLYLGLQIAFIGAIPSHALINGWENLNFLGDVGPFAGLVGGLGIIWLLKLLYIDAAISPTGTGLIYVTSTARILYAMSEMGYMPRFLSRLNKQNFPVWAILTNFTLGMFIFLPFPGWESMVSFLVSGMVLSYAMGPIALLSLRLELPNKQRFFYLPGSKFLCLMAFYFCNLFAYWTGWDTIYKLAIAILIGFFFFGLACFSQQKMPQDKGMKSIFWIVPYFGGLIMISYLGAFGGKNFIPFGWDFLVIGIFSVVILYLAVVNRARLLKENFIPSSFLAETNG